MVEDSANREKILEFSIARSQQWLCRQNEQPLTRWLAREVGFRADLFAATDFRLACVPRGPPRGAGDQPGWPAHWDESVARLVIATVRFSRPDGSPAGDFNGSASFAPPARCFGAG